VEARGGKDFIRTIIEEDLRAGRHQQVVTRFPPEPNGYLHIGHVKAICLDFGLPEEYGGRCHLRFDDTNPETEDTEYVDAIQADVRWLGFDWGEHLFYASDYFDRLYAFAVELIEAGKAYVCDLKDDEIRAYRGTVTEPGRPSPYRDRTVAENLELFARMRAGEFADGARTLRARIDMASNNMKMRDPLLYRIRHAHHHRTGDAWPIYPMYDFAHCLSDAIEGITHSLCTLEFDNNRELYDWIVDNVTVDARPHQYEFARLALTYTMMSKRKLKALVLEGKVAGWDDPRMSTLAGIRRRGYTPEALRAFVKDIGVAKTNSVVDVARLEHFVRQDLNDRAPRVMGVLRPLEVVIESYPEDQHAEVFDVPYFPGGEGEGSRAVPFSRTIYIDREDFAVEPPRKWRRLWPGGEVRLRSAYVIRCVGYDVDDAGEVVRLRCTHDPSTRGGATPPDRKVKGTIHWVSAEHALTAEVRMYDRLFSVEQPASLDELNEHSLEVIADAKLEPSIARDPAGTRYQLERVGYFCLDSVDSRPERPVLNLIVGLRDGYRAAKQDAAPAPVVPAAVERVKEVVPVRTVALSPELQAVADELVGRGVAEDDARVLAGEDALRALVHAAAAAGAEISDAAKWTVHEVASRMKSGAIQLDGEALAALLGLLSADEITSSSAKKVLDVLCAEGGDPAAIVDAHGLRRLDDDGAIHAAVAAAIAAHPAEAERFRGGEGKLMGFFIGQVMRATGGRADAGAVRQALVRALR
jgi:glutaminyl-tRNA synthetase